MIADKLEKLKTQEKERNEPVVGEKKEKKRKLASLSGYLKNLNEKWSKSAKNVDKTLKTKPSMHAGIVINEQDNVFI